MMINKRPSGPSPVVFAAIALAALVGGGLWFNMKPNDSSSGPQPIQVTASPEALPSPEMSPSPTPSDDASPAPRTEVTIYTKVDDEDGSHLEPKTVPATGDAAANNPEAALSAMAKLPNSPLPKGTVVNKAYVQSNGLAMVDFNPAFKANFSGGDRGEGMVLQAITQTMGQFGAKQVQITVGGKKIDSLGGMESLQKPLLVAVPNQSKDESAQ